MTVANTDGVSSPQATNGVTRVWNFDFLVYDPSHLFVEISDGTGVVEEVRTGLLVSGVSNPAGGTVTFPQEPSPALTAGYTVRIKRDVPYGQSFQFTNVNALYPKDIEKALDLQAMQIMQLRDRINELEG